jgi:cephalosporin hydroxylase
MSDYGDIRDLLVALPFGDPDGKTNYVRADIFPIRHQLIAELDPPPRSVFEFGALYGYFLVTALDAAPTIRYVGFVDNESHTPDSNRMAAGNVWTVRGTAELEVFRDREEMLGSAARYDLVQVDADHSYAECLADLQAADRLGARWVFVDDATAFGHFDAISRAVEAFRSGSASVWSHDVHETVNGLVVLTRLEALR